MHLSRCTICHYSLPGGAEDYACAACAYRLRGLLLELPEHLPLLAELLQPGSGLPGRGGAGRAHSPMPVRLDVMNLLGPGHVVVLADPHGDQSAGVPITPLLYGWARYIAAAYPAVGHDAHGTVRVQPCDGAYSRHGSDAAAWCRWLIGYLPYAVTQSWIVDMYQQIEDLVWRVRAKTDRRPRRITRDAPCPACDGWALVTVEGEPYTVCEGCGHRLTADEYRAHSEAVLPALTALAVRIHSQAVTAAERHTAA